MMTGSAQRMAASAFLGAMAGLIFALGVHAAEPTQLSYTSSDEAAAALVTAARSHGAAALRTILGPGSATLISSGDNYADEAALRHFIELYHARHALVPEDADHVMLEVAANCWPLPIPIVRQAGRWSFDAEEGAQEITGVLAAMRSPRSAFAWLMLTPKTIISTATSRRAAAACTHSNS
jgi:Protein of unknown function (DUF2950)